jgi:hypothetical protein
VPGVGPRVARCLCATGRPLSLSLFRPASLFAVLSHGREVSQVSGSDRDVRHTAWG